MPMDFTAEVESIIFREDPIGIASDYNVGEYMPEAREIVSELAAAQSEQGLQAIIHEIFTWSYDDVMAGPPERYESIAMQVWAIRDRAH
jgi:hypothetical protein